MVVGHGKNSLAEIGSFWVKERVKDGNGTSLPSADRWGMGIEKHRAGE